jgi:hypothetical protein
MLLKGLVRLLFLANLRTQVIGAGEDLKNSTFSTKLHSTGFGILSKSAHTTS